MLQNLKPFFPSNFSMSKCMSISVNGQSQIPPGFRFHPTEEELLNYYLRKKVSCQKIDLDVILEVDLNKVEPWEILEECKIGTSPQNDWYIFSRKDKKYPSGTRTNRATFAGFWKATGRDKVIYSHCKRIGMRKTLVFYKGRAPHGNKTDMIMHEYRLENMNAANAIDNNFSNGTGEATQEEDWVVCRIFKKKNHQETLENPNFKKQDETNKPISYDQDSNTTFSNWIHLDRLVASQLNGQSPHFHESGGGAYCNAELDFLGHNNEIDLWNFSPSFSHMPNN